jgi:hypothetical protein
MKKLPIFISLLFILTCAKEDSQATNTPPSQIVKQYALTATAGDGGSVTGGGTFASGTQVSLTATPNSGYSFSGWSTGSTANPLTVTLNTNTTITANFEVLINSYTLTVVSTDGGSATGAGDYNEGTEVTLIATPQEGYRFTGWSDGSTEESITITLNSDTALNANFELIPVYTLTVTAGDGGSISGAGDYNEGTELILAATANQGYVFNGWEDGINQNPRNLTVNEDLTLTANFISVNLYFNELYSNSSIINDLTTNSSSDNYNKNFRPFYDYNSFIDRTQYEFVYVLENGDVGLNPIPSSEHDFRESVFTKFLDINNNEISDLVIVASDVRTEFDNIVYVVIDNVLEYTFTANQPGVTRKLLSGDIDNNGSEDIVLVSTGIDTQPYSGAQTKIIYFTPNSYEIADLDNTQTSYFHTGTIGDVNNDNNLDIIIINNQNNVSEGYTYVYLGNGDKTFSKVYQGDTSFFGNRYNTDFYDFNLDGNLDIIIGGHEWSGGDNSLNRPHRNSIYYGNGDGTFDYDNPILLPESDYWGIVNDFLMYDTDNDGISEIIVNRAKGHESFNVVENDKGYDGIQLQILKKIDEEYIEHQIIDGPDGWFDTPPTWIEWIPFIEMFDVNGDNILDIVPDSEGISNPNYNGLKRFWGLYYRGIPGGTFEIDFFDSDSINN